MNRQDIEQLFSVGDTLPCGGDEKAFALSAILDDRILLRPTAAGAGEVSLDYGVIAAALATSDNDGGERDISPLQCFVSAYRKRAQIRHEDNVDALWRSAGELFLGPVCTMPDPQNMGSIPACPLDASFFLPRR